MTNTNSSTLERSFRYPTGEYGYQLTEREAKTRIFLAPSIFTAVTVTASLLWLNSLTTNITVITAVYVGIAVTAFAWLLENTQNVNLQKKLETKIAKHVPYTRMMSLKALAPVTEWLINEQIYHPTRKGEDGVAGEIFDSLQQAVNESDLTDRNVSWETDTHTITVERVTPETVKISVSETVPTTEHSTPVA